MRSWSRDVITRATALVYGLTGAFAVAMVRHSWRAAYNFPKPNKIMGRYAVYFAALFVVLAFMMLPRALTWFRERPARAWLLGVIVPALFVWPAWGMLVEGRIVGNLARLISDRGCVDVYRMALVGTPILAAIGVLLAMPALPWRSHRALASALTLSLAVFYLMGASGYHERLVQHQRYALHGRELASALDDAGALEGGSFEIHLAEEVLAETQVSIERIVWGMRFWGAVDVSHDQVATIYRADPSDATTTTLALVPERDASGVPTREYDFFGDGYAILAE